MADSTLVNVSCIILNTGSLVLEFSVAKGRVCDIGFEIVIHSRVCSKPSAFVRIHKRLLFVTRRRYAV